MFKKFVDYLTSLEPSAVHIFLHHNADPDAICAAEAYGHLFLKLLPGSSYTIYSDDINSTATRIMEEMSIKVKDSMPSLDEDKPNLILTVDTANLSQLGKYASWVDEQSLPLIVIDHHDTSELAEHAVASIVDTDTSSTCILAAKSFVEGQIEIEPRIATLMMSGHLYDSRRLLYGSTAYVFDILAELIRAGGDYELANEVLQNEMSHGEIIARFKASQRLKYSVLDNQVIVVTSKVKAFEASAARSFIGAGADVTMVLAPKNDELRGSARVRSGTGLNVGEVMSELAKKYGGSGGGHAAAAGFNIVPRPSNKVQRRIRSDFVKIVERHLNQETNS